MNRRSAHAFFLLLAGCCVLLPGRAWSGWEVGAKTGFDTNVDRSVSDGSGDVFFTGYGAYLRPATGATRLEWTVSAVLEGAAYARITGLDYGAISIAPGLVYNLSPDRTLSLSPFASFKAVRDTDQSALAAGAKVDLRQRFRRNLYLGGYGSYTHSRARVDTYSYNEYAVGAVFGGDFRSGLSAELTYEFSHGDSFLSEGVSSASAGTGGGPGAGNGGMSRRFSSTFGTEVFKDTVNSHAVDVSTGIDWSPSVFSRVGYTYRIERGDAGTSESHSGFAGLGCRF